MASNILVSYDLGKSDQKYEHVTDHIRDAGEAMHLNESFWFIKSKMSIVDIADNIWAAMNATSDTLVVVDASESEIEHRGFNPEESVPLNGEWYN